MYLLFLLLACLVRLAVSTDRHPNDRTLTCTYDDSQHKRVLIDYYLMSQCPDALVCIQQYHEDVKLLDGYVNVQFSHIVQSMSDDGTEFKCMHGVSECDGNKQQCCIQQQANARKSHGDTTQQLYDYMMCQSTDYKDIPSNGEPCARLTNFDSGDLQHCMATDTGNQLLYHSVQRTKHAGATKSCTMNLDHKQFAVHDSTWNTSDGVAPDLIDAVCTALQHKNAPKPAICK